MRHHAKRILKDARERYGKGWELMSDDQRQNFVESRVLRLLLTQGMGQFEAAQSLAESVLAELQTR